MIRTAVWFPVVLVLTFAPSLLKAQDSADNRFGHKFLFEVMTTDTRSGVRQPVYISAPDTSIDDVYQYFDGRKGTGFSNTVPKSAMLLGVKLAPGLTNYFSAVVQSVSKDIYSFSISDTSAAELVAIGINLSNFHDYRYRVIENDSTEIIPWTEVPEPVIKFGSGQKICYLGSFRSPGKYLLVEVVNKNKYSNRDAVIFDWRSNYRPVLEAITVDVKDGYFDLLDPVLNRGFATRFDRMSGAPLDFRFEAGSVPGFVARFRKQETITRSVHLIRQVGRKTDTIKLGFIDPYGSWYLGNEEFNQPGKYEFVVQRQHKIPDWDDAQLVRIPFEVLPAGQTAALPRWVLPLIIIVCCLLAAGLLLYNRSVKQKISRSNLQKQQAQLRLKTVRAQLNPHFLFNALSSIQNLINKRQVREANDYLSIFARLTRAVLDSGDVELISLEDELNINKAYLEMEKLRFGFAYHIEVGPAIDSANTEVPPMLLQPFLENAVKHGLAAPDEGIIKLIIERRGRDLAFIVSDNGKWINGPEGFGIRLSADRIRLLNDYYPGSLFSLQIIKQDTGTVIEVTIMDWFN